MKLQHQTTHSLGRLHTLLHHAMLTKNTTLLTSLRKTVGFIPPALYSPVNEPASGAPRGRRCDLIRMIRFPSPERERGGRGSKGGRVDGKGGSRIPVQRVTDASGSVVTLAARNRSPATKGAPRAPSSLARPAAKNPSPSDSRIMMAKKKTTSKSSRRHGPAMRQYHTDRDFDYLGHEDLPFAKKGELSGVKIDARTVLVPELVALSQGWRGVW